MDIRKMRKVKVINTAEGRIVSSAFSIGYKESIEVDTRRLQERVLNDLNFFYEDGKVAFEEIKEDKHEKGSVNIEKITTEHGAEHTIFKPSDRLINVEEIDTSGKAINMGFSKMDAIDMLGKHWKSLEKEVLGTSDISKLSLLLSVAREQVITGKKLEIIENRLNKLK